MSPTTLFDEHGNLTDSGKAVIRDTSRDVVEAVAAPLWAAVEDIRLDVKALSQRPTPPCQEHTSMMTAVTAIRTGQGDAKEIATERMNDANRQRRTMDEDVRDRRKMLPTWLSLVFAGVAAIVATCALLLTVHSLISKAGP
jgi:hypothetical protein